MNAGRFFTIELLLNIGPDDFKSVFIWKKVYKYKGTSKNSSWILGETPGLKS